MGDEYTPTTDEVRETYERARYYLDDTPEEGDSYRAGGGEFDRWITAHDRALREQIADDLRIEALNEDPDIPDTYREGIRDGLMCGVDIARGEGSE
jgi:hypothetical protein